uniref:Tudor domain-containing protein n=1 Tax=Eptatretus burgeri TaxID=7764 RepID=A0A8C4Q901_EPTBU
MVTRKLPCRPGIVFEAGARLEAQDYLHKWYPSRIEKVDLEQGKILIHFERWNHRYDEWLSCGSPRLRPLQRTSLRREGLREEQLPFKVGEEVLARWIDCRYYPAKVASLCREGTYTVCFYDGVTKSVKGMNVKPMPDDLRGQDLSTLVKSVGREASSELGSKEHGGCVDDDEQEEEQEQEQEQERKPEQEQEQEQEPTEESDISLHQAPLFEHPNSGMWPKCQAFYYDLIESLHIMPSFGEQLALCSL